MYRIYIQLTFFVLCFLFSSTSPFVFLLLSLLSVYPNIPGGDYLIFVLLCVVQEAGLREGDYIVAVDGQDCKWAKHGEVVHMLKSCSDRGVDLSVVTLHSHDTQVSKCMCVFEMSCMCAYLWSDQYITCVC